MCVLLLIVHFALTVARNNTPGCAKQGLYALKIFYTWDSFGG
jgi:hypothetical protein